MRASWDLRIRLDQIRLLERVECRGSLETAGASYAGDSAGQLGSDSIDLGEMESDLNFVYARSERGVVSTAFCREGMRPCGQLANFHGPTFMPGATAVTIRSRET